MMGATGEPSGYYPTDCQIFIPRNLTSTAVWQNRCAARNKQEQYPV
jgi:hypothetical protein